MFRKCTSILAAALVLLSVLPGAAGALQVDSGAVYCFSPEDFPAEEPLAGICITSIPTGGQLMLGSRVLRSGDVLTAHQLSAMTFHAPDTLSDSSAQLEYLPIWENRVASCAVMSIAIRGKQDKAPTAEDFAVETYKNLPLTQKLKVSDPEGQALTYTVTRQPRRGTVTIAEDGSFTYTPKKNKVGVDSFRFTAADPTGNVSREATVTVTILKPADASQYADTAGRECRFAAEWMKNTGIFAGESLGDSPCFHPEAAVTRGQFVTMLVKALEIPTEEEVQFTGYTDEIPQWLQPYLAAAVRSGLTADLPDHQTFGAEELITGAEAAVMLQNALDLAIPMPESNAQALSREELVSMPVWAAVALSTMEEHGMELSAAQVLTREDAALLLYKAAKLNASDEEI